MLRQVTLFTQCPLGVWVPHPGSPLLLDQNTWVRGVVQS